MSGGGIIRRWAESSSASNEELKKKRLSSRALGEDGLSPLRVWAVNASYPSGVQIDTDRGESGVTSWEAARTTPPESAARNFEGTVSLCLASSACSNVPRKFKGSHPAGRILEPGWPSGRSPATR